MRQVDAPLTVDTPAPPRGAFVPPFRVWALLFPEWYYLIAGPWRKAMMFIALSVGLGFVPNPEGGFALFLGETYAALGLERFGVGAAMLATLPDWAARFTLNALARFPALGLVLTLACLFRRAFAAAALCLAAGAGGFLWALVNLPQIDLGVASGLVWLAAQALWPGIAAVLFFALYTRDLPFLWAGLGAGASLALLGLPLEGFPLREGLRLLLGVAAGCMAGADRQRRAAGERFWW